MSGPDNRCLNREQNSMAALTQHPSSVAQKLQTLRGNRALRLLSDAEIRQQLAGITVPKEADAVFEGGGVKGIALAGAIQVAELLGVRWKSVAGTSAGAIAAALLAAGYSSRELVTILTREMDFNKFMDEGIVDKLPLIGKLASALFEKGIYEGDYFESWLGQKLAQRGVHTFADLRDGQGGYRLKMIASDVTQRKMVVLPDQLPEYGRDPDSFPVARAARMSMSIPYFFEPVMLDYPGASGARCKAYIVDGGMLSNFPVWLFDAPAGTAPRWPTYGFKLVEPDSDRPAPERWPHQYIMALVNTMMEAHDRAYIEQANFKRTIAIPTMGIQTTQFNLTDEEETLLVRAGQEAAIKFFREWSFDRHNQTYRGTP